MDKVVKLTPADLACATALSRGVLKREGKSWRFGRRLFSNSTVKRAIDRGIGERVGTEVHGNEYP